MVKLLRKADSGKLDKVYEQAKNATDASGNKKYTTEQLKQIKANLDKVRNVTPQPEKKQGAKSKTKPFDDSTIDWDITDVGIEEPEVDEQTQERRERNRRIREDEKSGKTKYKEHKWGENEEADKIKQEKINRRFKRWDDKIAWRNMEEKRLKDSAEKKAREAGESEEAVQNIRDSTWVRTNYPPFRETPKLNRDNILRIKRRDLKRGRAGYEGKTLADLDDHERKTQRALGNHEWQPPPHEESPWVTRRLDVMEARNLKQEKDAKRLAGYQPSPPPKITPKQDREAQESDDAGDYMDIKRSVDTILPQRILKSIRKKSYRDEDDNSHQLGVGRRDGETDKLSSPAGSNVGVLSKNILKQGLLDMMLKTKKDEIKALIPSAEEKDETQSELPELIGVEDNPHRGKMSNVHAYNKNKKLNKAREQGDGKGVDPTGKDPLRGKPNRTNERYSNADMGAMSYMAKDYDGDRKARIAATKVHFAHRLFGVACSCEQYGEREPFVEKGIGDFARGAGQKLGSAVEGVKNVGRDFKEGFTGQQQKKPSPTPRDSVGSQRIGAADFSSRTKPQYSSKPTPRGKAGVDPGVTLRPGDKEGQARFKGVAEQVNRGIASRAAAGDPKAQAAHKLTQATQRRIADKKAAKQGFPKETDLSGRREDFEPGGKFHGRKKTPAEILQHRLQPGDSNPRKMLKSGSGAPLASAEKPVAVMAAEQSGMYSVDGKNLDNDPLANKAPMENVNQTDAATRSINITTDNSGRKTFHQKAEPTLCSSKEVFNSILEKTYYDDQVLERYKNSGKGDKNKSKRRHITNGITDTAGQQSNKTRGI